jgi:hypothetical protein
LPARQTAALGTPLGRGSVWLVRKLIPDTSEAGKKDEYLSVVAKLKTGLATSDRGVAMQIALDAADAIVSISDE